MTYPADQDDLSAVCPYLGLADDADSHATYATEAHRCYRLEQPTRIASGHQETYCLGSNHVTCPVYRGEGIGATSRAGAAGAGAAAAASAGRGRGRPPREGRPAEGRGREGGNGARRSPALDRKRPTGTLGPKARGGGISMPTATIALFALAAVVLVLAFVLNQALGGGDDDNGSLSAADRFASQQAQTRTPTSGAGGQETPAGDQTPDGNGTPEPTQAGGGDETPAATPTTGGGGGGLTYEVESGDICGTIASAHDLTLDEFMDLNPGIDCTNLQVGQEVNVG